MQPGSAWPAGPAPRLTRPRRTPVAKTAHRTQITHAVLRLRELILSGEFAPGERMSELPLVARLGVSRTPLRLALAELEHEGLLRVLPGGGYVVREFTEADVRDAVELRGVLEGTAARFAAERGGRRRATGARCARSTMRSASSCSAPNTTSFERYLELNERFHARLLRASRRSPLLQRSLDAVSSLPFAGPSAFVLAEAEHPASRDILIVAHRQHDDLIEAIEARQGARAEGIAREHARLAITNLDDRGRPRATVLERIPGAAAGWSDARSSPRPVTRRGRQGVWASMPSQQRGTRCAIDLLAAGTVGVLQRRAHRHRRERRADPLDRRLEVVEGCGLQLRGELGAEAAGADGLVGDDRAAGALQRRGDRLEIERHQRPRVEDVGLDRPPPASRSAAVSASPTIRESAMIVTSRPRAPRWARPRGSGASAAGAGSRRK